MPERTTDIRTFQEAARLVRKRLQMRHFLARLSRTVMPVALAAVGASILARLLHAPTLVWLLPALLLAGWLAGCAALVWHRRPGLPGALAKWDEATGAKEAFLSAGHFEAAGDQSPGAALHLNRAYAELPQRLRDLPTDLPLRLRGRVILFPALVGLYVLAMLLLPWLEATAPQETMQTGGIRKAGDEVRKFQNQLQNLQAPDPAAQKALEELAKKLEQSAKRLDKEIGSERDALKELEDRAREAEKLAQGLGEEGGEGLSEAMLAELEQHAETDALAAALRSGSAEEIAKQLAALADKVGQANLQQRERIQRALRSALAAANANDKKTRIGKGLDQAHQQMRQGDHPAAAKTLRDLSNTYAASARRQGMQKKLQQLAQQLRNASGSVTGRLAPAPGNISNLSAGNGALPMPGAPYTAAMPSGAIPPGGAPPASGKYGHGNNAPPAPPGSPVPGTCSSSGRPGGAPVPGSRPGAGGQRPGGNGGGGCAPVPGSMPGALAGAGAGNQPGGSQAGNGSVALGGEQTARMRAATTDTVTGAPGTGPSTARQIAGQGGRERAATGTQEAILMQIGEAESGLDDEPLPLSRRDQVRRYFTIMRQRTADTPSSGDAPAP